jgi:hypothetical protein
MKSGAASRLAAFICYYCAENTAIWPKYCQESKSRILRLAGHVPLIGEIRNAHDILVGNPKGRLLGRSKRGWEIIKIIKIRLFRFHIWREFPDCLSVIHLPYEGSVP